MQGSASLDGDVNFLIVEEGDVVVGKGLDICEGDILVDCDGGVGFCVYGWDCDVTVGIMAFEGNGGAKGVEMRVVGAVVYAAADLVQVESLR